MSQGTKSQLYQELKSAGVVFDRHYREYSTDELQASVDLLRQQPGYVAPAPKPVEPQLRLRQAEPEYAAQRAYQRDDGEKPIRTDENGFIWFREEVKKPAFPKSRARRKLTYLEPGVTSQTVVNGKYVETFEVAGDEHRTGEVRITMPSYQVGVYLDPRFPFKVHVYNDNRGFDLFDVQKFYGGGDLVPQEIKRLYVANDLCYDIRTTIRAIQAEARQLQLKENR